MGFDCAGTMGGLCSAVKCLVTMPDDRAASLSPKCQFCYRLVRLLGFPAMCRQLVAAICLLVPATVHTETPGLAPALTAERRNRTVVAGGRFQLDCTVSSPVPAVRQTVLWKHEDMVLQADNVR